MTRIGLDHLYRETHHWAASVAWWEALGFAFTEQWGSEPHRAGRLANGAASVVLAEAPSDRSLAASVFLTTDDLDAVATATHSEITETHWGTTMVSLSDPDGRTYNIEPEGTR